MSLSEYEFSPHFLSFLVVVRNILGFGFLSSNYLGFTNQYEKKNAVKREHNLQYFLVFTLKDQVTTYQFFVSGNPYPMKVVVTLHKVCSGLCHSRQTGRSGGTE